MTLGQSVIVAAMILLVAVFCVFMVFKRSGTKEKQFVRVAVENIPDFKAALLAVIISISSLRLGIVKGDSAAANAP